MNRELKFRAWIKKYKRMSEVTSVFPRKKSLQCTFDRYTFDEVELMQYTGRKDKNGVEIYEGDIIYISGIINRAYQIFWSEEYLRYLLISTTGVDGKIGDILEAHLKSVQNRIEVIGNIYENPELLKVGEE